MSETKDMFAIRKEEGTWKERFSERAGMPLREKMLVQDGDTGMMIREAIYPKGFKTKWHVHPCSHGMYVLSGKLKTHEGVYGPGSLVWFWEGGKAEHGATDEEDLHVLFISNKEFAIEYLDEQTD